ncbi:MAG: inorganic diphosphatase [Bacteroidota bacterium]
MAGCSTGKQDQATGNGEDTTLVKPDYENYPAFSENGYINAVVEIPAGTSHKIEFDHVSGEFLNDTFNGMIRIVEFLPYPGNYGFIPSTLMDTATGGDGDPLDIIIISESVPTGTIMEIVPIGILLLYDYGEADYKVVAVPADEEKRIVRVRNFSEFSEKQAKAKLMLEQWFLSYKGEYVMEFEGWGNEAQADSIIRSCLNQ